MSLTKVRIKSVVIGAGPMTSLVVLQPTEKGSQVELPIRIGNVEAAALSMGVDPRPGGRPMTHDLLLSALDAVGATVEGVRVVAVSGTTFFAQLDLLDAQGERHLVDARPSDALSLAVRRDLPIWADDEVLGTASMPDFHAVEAAEREAELAEFHDFVNGITPDDFRD